MTLRSASRVTPGISLLPRTRGPIPERKRRLPTRLACGKAPSGAGAGFEDFDFPITRRSIGYERIEQLTRDTSHAIDRPLECCLVRFCWMGEAAQLAHELQCRGADFLVGRPR